MALLLWHVMKLDVNSKGVNQPVVRIVHFRGVRRFRLAV
jgi:hypothetical protein